MLFILLESSAFSDDTEFKLGILTELSGAGAEIGQECRRGAEIAFQGLTDKGQVGKLKLRLVFGDTQDDARATVGEFNKLIKNDGVQAVVMSRSKTAMPVNSLSRQAKIPVVATAGHPGLLTGNPYAFRAYLNADNEGSFLAEKVFALGLRRMALITIQDEWNLAYSSVFAERFKQLGGSIVFEETLVPSDSDFFSLVSRIKRANPEGLFCNLQLAQSGPFIKKVREQGLRARLFSNYWLQKPAVQESAGKAAIEGLMFNEVDAARPKFLALAKQLFPNEAPTPGAYICYVAAASVIQALKNAQDGVSQKPLSDVLLSLEQVTLLDDVLLVRSREVQYPQKLRIIRNGVVVDAGI